MIVTAKNGLVGLACSKDKCRRRYWPKHPAPKDEVELRTQASAAGWWCGAGGFDICPKHWQECPF